MIPTKSRKIKGIKLPKNLERMYKEGKCRECAVVLTRMDFAKILGKFTKVKIQYEVGSTPKGKANDITRCSTPKLKSQENGVVHKNTNEQPAKNVSNLTKSKTNDTITPSPLNNVLKENNRIKNSVIKDKNSNYESNQTGGPNLKQYAIVFNDPTVTLSNDIKNETTLVELLPHINNNILPSEGWCIDYFPKNDEPKDDKVYDRIAAELEDLMNSGKPLHKPEEKVDDFPSIMDILNDNGTGTNKASDQAGQIVFKPDLESNDVEAILLGKSDEESKTPDSTPMDVDSSDMSSLIPDVEQFNAIQSVDSNSTNLSEPATNDVIENPHSPSILDEALQKGIEEHLPPGNLNNTTQANESNNNKDSDDNVSDSNVKPISDTDHSNSTKSVDINETTEPEGGNKDATNSLLASKAAIIAQVVFKKTIDGECHKTVTCMKNLKYIVELDGKSVEFLGAPKCISSLDDLQILLQIVNESELKSFYVLQ